MEDKVITRKESALVHLIDLIYVPTSFLRLAYKIRKRKDFGVIEKYKETQTGKFCAMIFPYPQALIFEAGRLYGYCKIAEYLFK